MIRPDIADRATVIGTVGSPEKAERARRAGADHVIEYRKDNIAARVREITGGAGVPVILDGVGKDAWEASLASAADCPSSAISPFSRMYA